MKKKKVLATGEFARLCKTTKATLFHYDQEGLLKPKYVSEKGYRYYGVEQFFDFSMITTLKEAGSTLQEVKAHIHHMDGEEFLALLDAKRLVIKRERSRLAQMELMLGDVAVYTREALDFQYDTLLVQRQEKESLEVFPTKMSPLGSIPEFVESLAEYLDFYQKKARYPRYPFGLIFRRATAGKELFSGMYFFSRATRLTKGSQLHIKQEGEYAVFAHRGTAETHLKAFEEFQRQIAAAGLGVAGEVYGYDMMSYTFQETDGRYAVKYCVLIR